jgi:RNA polymerase sigma factor (sigma-70 family)
VTANCATYIVQHIFQPKNIYDELINNILGGKNAHLKSALISELATYFLENPDKIITAWNSNYFKYYFVRVITNTVNSNTSPFYKREIIKDTNYYDAFDENDFEDIPNEKDLMYKKIDLALKRVKVSWFESEIFKLYYQKGLSYREIEKECNIDHVYAYKTTKKVLDLVKEEIKKNKS